MFLRAAKQALGLSVDCAFETDCTAVKDFPSLCGLGHHDKRDN